MTIFKLPDLGEGLPDAEISEWHVKVGDHVVLDQSLVSMETAKAVVEVPSPFTGKIKKLYGNVGDVIKTGSPLVELESDEKQESNNTGTAPQEQISATQPTKDDAATVAGRLQVGDTVLKESAAGIPIGIRTANGSNVKATPAVRALAQRLRVNLATITPTGPHNTITTQDVEAASKLPKHAIGQDLNPSSQTGTGATRTVGDGTADAYAEKENALAPEYEPLKGVRRTMAHAMMQAHSEVVPVTVVEDAILSRWKEKQDITVRLIQAINEALKIEPALNAWFDSKTLSRRFMKDVHLGMAVDTPDGLFVPVIHQADSLDANTLRKTVDRLKKQTMDRTIKPEDLRGATLTLSNFGKFAGRYANPIVVPPMVAILGVGRLRDQVVSVEGQAKVCSVLPLALTFDHRAVTGGEATRFLGAVIEALERE